MALLFESKLRGGLLPTANVDTSGLGPFAGKVEASIMRAARLAGSGAVRAMRAEGSRQIRGRKAIKVAAVNDAISLIFPTNKDVLVWGAKASGRPVPLVDFPHSQTSRGVSVMVNVGSRSLIPSAFVAQLRSGHTGIFMRRLGAGPQTKRQAKRGQRVRVGRLPIDEAYTTTVADAFRDAVPAMVARGRTVFGRDFTRLVPLELAKLRERAAA